MIDSLGKPYANLSKAMKTDRLAPVYDTPFHGVVPLEKT